MLRDPNFNNYTFYHQVEYQDNNQFYQLDFLVVSPFEVMVLESKYWNGITYLYNKSYKDIFQNTLFKDFGVGSSERIKVFNARFLEDKEKEIVFSCYKNPVSQVRKYSHEIRKRLNLPYVKNAVVFHKSKINNVLFNDQEFNMEAVDTYTKIITNKALKEYLLEELNDKKEVSREEIIDSIVDEEKQPADIIEKCRNIDVGYTYNEYTEIKTDEDVKNFVIATGEFHDARIIKEIMQADGTLYLRFDGIWGCEVEVWFWGELEYDTSVRHIENLDPYWSCSTLMIKDGFIYFVDEFFEEEELSLDLIKQGEYCYFKAQHMKYHIIPN